MDTISNLINSVELTKTQQIIAEYVLDNSEDVCFSTSMELAQAMDVSEASIVRFSRSLGFTGFMDFQKALRDEYKKRVSQIPNDITIPSQRIMHSLSKNKEFHGLLNFYKSTTDNLETLIKTTPAKLIEDAAKVIISSKHKYVLGTRANAGIAEYALLYLKQMLPEVEGISNFGTNPIDRLCDISSKDVLLAFSFPRYSSLDKVCLKMASDAGAKIVLITDKASADLAKYADILLIAPVDSISFFNSLIAPQFLIEVLLNVISSRTPEIEKRLELIDKYLDDIGAY